MRGQKRLQYCLELIVEKLDWGESHLWKETDFINLSELIYKETEISISPHTLKRLFGKIKYKEHYNPQRATKNALAKFVGFKDWVSLTLHYNEEFNVEPSIKKQQKKRKPYMLIIGLLLLFSVAIFVFILKDPKKDTVADVGQGAGPFSFNISDTLGTVPYTVTVNYDIKNLTSDSVYLDFNFDHPMTGPEIKNLDKARSFYNYSYQIPGYYHITLKDQTKVLASKKVLASSPEWFSYYYPENSQVPWLNKRIHAPNENGYLYQTTENLAKEGFDINSVYFINHRLFKNFDIDGDNFQLKIRFKNSKSNGGITCYDFFLSLFCENDVTELKLMERGCSGYSGLKIGGLNLNGVDEDLSSLTFDPERWNDLRMVIQNNTVEVFINEALVFSTPYTGTNGNIVGIEQLFKGTGILDYVYLQDLTTEKVFYDDF